VSSTPTEDAVAPWANQASEDDEGHTEQDLALDELNNADYHEDEGDDP
jgi:hypothetical protein